MEISKRKLLNQINSLKDLTKKFIHDPNSIDGARDSQYSKGTFYESILELIELLELLDEIVDIAFEYTLEKKIIDYPEILEDIFETFLRLYNDPEIKGYENNIRRNDEVMYRVIKGVDSLADRVEAFAPYLFAVKINRDKNIEINRLLARFNEIRPILESIETFDAKVQNALVRAEEAASYIEGKRSELNYDIGKLNSSLKTIEEGRKATDEILEQGRKKLADIEEKLKIQEEQLKDTSEIGNLHEEAKKLIEQSKLALNLKNAEGISAAFASRVHVDGWWNRRLTPWLLGALVFVVIAGILSYLLVVDTSITIDSIGQLVGRVIGVGLTVSAATFCAKQYTKQKNIEEDYHYKAILSKSITTFTEEIKKTDETKVAEYLTHVLSEIHKDPLRERKNDETGVVDANQILEKVLALVEKAK